MLNLINMITVFNGIAYAFGFVPFDLATGIIKTVVFNFVNIVKFLLSTFNIFVSLYTLVLYSHFVYIFISTYTYRRNFTAQQIVVLPEEASRLKDKSASAKERFSYEYRKQ